ncbi:hypothetical protein [Microbacterium sp. Leaf179]|uniref:hypothetical protein n=1 Tax=Microbacterium sp. Leaf179 TaxID=1736288 RepID=UPI0006F61707|nr:hypothetical protein [Microbacterium sp. Leaf179]KQR88976.1 hypothetical protein ASF96_04290 [Microbacterium sp. Leaf179]
MNPLTQATWERDVLDTFAELLDWQPVRRGDRARKLDDAPPAAVMSGPSSAARSLGTRTARTRTSRTYTSDFVASSD